MSATPARRVAIPDSSDNVVAGRGTAVSVPGGVRSIESGALSSEGCRLGPGEEGAVECSGEEAVEPVVWVEERREGGGETSGFMRFPPESNRRELSDAARGLAQATIAMNETADGREGVGGVRELKFQLPRFLVSQKSQPASPTLCASSYSLQDRIALHRSGIRVANNMPCNPSHYYPIAPPRRTNASIEISGYLYTFCDVRSASGSSSSGLDRSWKWLRFSSWLDKLPRSRAVDSRPSTVHREVLGLAD